MGLGYVCREVIYLSIDIGSVVGIDFRYSEGFMGIVGGYSVRLVS